MKKHAIRKEYTAICDGTKIAPATIAPIIEVAVPAIDVIRPVGALQGALRHTDKVAEIDGEIYAGDDRFEVFLPFCTPWSSVINVEEHPIPLEYIERGHNDNM